MRDIQEICRDIMTCAKDDSQGYNTAFLKVCALLQEYGDTQFDKGCDKYDTEVRVRLHNINHFVKSTK